VVYFFDTFDTRSSLSFKQSKMSLEIVQMVEIAESLEKSLNLMSIHDVPKEEDEEEWKNSQIRRIMNWLNSKDEESITKVLKEPPFEDIWEVLKLRQMQCVHNIFSNKNMPDDL
jgi:hypothetical protein